MENIMVKHRYVRRPSTSARLRRAPRTGLSLRAVIMRQIAICLLILLVILIFKNINISATNYITEKITFALKHNVELESIFTTVEKFAADIRKSISPDEKADTAPDDSNTSDALSASASTADKDASAGKSAADADGGQDISSTQANTATLSSEETVNEGAGDEEARDMGTVDMGTGSYSSADRIVEATSSIDNSSEFGRNEGQDAVMPEKSVLSAGTESLNQYAEGMLTPVDGTLGTVFGEMTDEITGVSKMHNGVDINVRQKSGIIAALEGKVTETGSSPAYGNYIVIDHGGGLKTVYGNCSHIIAGKGENVKKGDTVAVIGDTGTSAGIHLHFEVWVNGTAMDPLEFISVPVR